MRRWMSRTLVGLGVLMAAAGAITTAGWGPGQQALAANYPEPLPMTDQVRGAVDAAPRPEHDPARPTAVVLIGAQGANAADTLAPYETLAASGKYNVYTAAPVRRPLPLTGGLDVVPDYTFEELARLPGDVDVVVVPALPDGMEPSSDPVRSFVAEQSAAGATVVGVCVGVEVLAGAGLLDGRDATTHWAVIDRFERHFTTVTWKRGVRYVDEGKVVTTAGVLSGVDGALRVLERDFGESVAREAAAAVRWPHYHPGGAATMPVSRLAPPDAVALLNLGYRDPARMGVLLTDGVGEIELASAFRPYTELSFVARPHTVTADDGPIRSRYGLMFVPRHPRAAVDGELDRLIVPGGSAGSADGDAAAAVAAIGPAPEYLHTREEFPFDAALRDIAATTDVATASWVSKTLEYPGRAELEGTAWPWQLALRVLLVGIAGAAVVVGAVLLLRRPRWRRFLGHLVEMVLAMTVGMMLLQPLWDVVAPSLVARLHFAAVIMGLDMALGMSLWMWIRGHGRRMIVEMAVAMVAPFVLLLVPFHAGLLSGSGVMMLGHVGMVVAMIGLMLSRFDHYSAHPWHAPWRRRTAAAPHDHAPSRQNRPVPDEDLFSKTNELQ